MEHTLAKYAKIRYTAIATIYIFGGNTMNRSELIAGMAADSGLTKADTEKALNAFLGLV